MRELLLVVCGLISGIIGGMGMGGGTLLVPLLGFFDLEQKVIQGINLISFLPMSIFALILHKKNKLLQTKNILWVIIPATVSAIGGAFLIKIIDQKTLKILFGLFLLIVGVWQIKKGLKKENPFETTI